jgi:hypothetical protein
MKMIKNNGGVESPVDAETRVVWSKKHDAFVLKFQCNGSWYVQWLVWSCRGGRAKYFKAMAILYRFIRRNGLSNKSLRELARG